MAFFTSKIGVAVLVLAGIGLGAGATFGVMRLLTPSATAAAAAPAPTPVKARPIFFSDLPGIVVSIPPQPNTPSTSYVDIDMQFATYDAKALENFNAVLPIIKADIISLLMSQTSGELQDQAVRAKVIASCLEIANNVLKQNGMANGAPPFNAAYITNLVIQD